MEVKKQVPEGYKLTEVGVIPVDWEVFPLSELSLKISVGIASSATHAYRNKGVVLFRNQNIKNGYLDDSDILYISPDYEEGFKNKRLKANDLLTARTGYPGATCIVPSKYEGAQSFTTLITRPDSKKVKSDYLSAYINSESGQIFFDNNQIGGGQKNVNAGSLKTMPIPLPPSFDEQTAIANALSDADALIAALDDLIEKKRQIKQGTMQQLLTPPHRGGRRLEGFSGAWEEKSLGEVVNFRNGKAHENQISEYGDYIVVNSRFVSTEGAIKKYSDYSICPLFRNEIVMVMSDVPNGRAIAKCFLIDKDNKYTLNQRICAIEAVDVDHMFLFRLIDRHQYYLAFDDGVKQTNLRKDDVLNCPIIIPPTLAEQTAIATILSDMDTEIEALEGKRAKYQSIKSGMMQELLTGRVRLV